MLLSSVCLILLSQQKALSPKDDMAQAVALWREYGRPVARTYELERGNYSYVSEHFTENVALSKALPLAEAGKVDQAIKVLQQRSPYDPGDQSWLGEPASQSIKAKTAMLIYIHLVNEYLNLGPADRILELLVKLNKQKLIAKSDHLTAHPGRGLNDFIADLSLTIRRKPAPPNTAQAAVDSLANVHSPGFDPSQFGFIAVVPPPPEYAKVLAFGINAIEPLIADLESKRLSRSIVLGQRQWRSNVVTVSIFAKDLVVKIAKGDLGTSYDSYLTKDQVRGWLVAKRAGKVDQWLMANVVTRDKVNGVLCNYKTFSVLSATRPNLIPKAIKAARAAGASPKSMMLALGASRLSEKAKNDLISGKS